MSRHSSSPVEQLFGLLFMVLAGVVAGAVVVGRFVWNLYTQPGEDREGSEDGKP